MTPKKDNDINWYVVGAFLIGILTFLGIWIYSFEEWGLLVGLLIGWLPALIGGFIVGVLWPFLFFGGIIMWFLVG